MRDPDDDPVTALQRGEGLAAWRQIADTLAFEIEGGRLAPGVQMPTEGALASRFSVNRHTVRRALAVLAERGLVRAAQGRGTFVRDSALPYAIGPRTRFSENVLKAGREARGELLSFAETVADGETATALAVPLGAPVLELRMRHRADGVPISTARCWLPLPRFQGLEAAYGETGSITRAFARFGVADYSRLSTRIRARSAAADEASLLELAPGRSVIVLTSVNVDADGVPIQATVSAFAADRVELVLEI